MNSLDSLYDRFKILEAELKERIENDQHNWLRIAMILDEIQKTRIYKLATETYTQYVMQLAEKSNLHVATLWRIKAAGGAYCKLMGYTDYQEGLDKTIVATPEQLEFLTRLKTVAPLDVIEDLENRMRKDDPFVRQTLHEAWQTYRPLKKGKTLRGHRNMRIKNDSPQILLLTDPDIQLELSAKNIERALKQADWLKNTIYSDKEKEKFVFKNFSEVFLRTGGSPLGRRIDVVSVIYDTDLRIFPTLVGFEIKVKLNDLRQDKKMGEYLPYCDLFFLAIPHQAEMIQAAYDTIIPQMGILAISESLIQGTYKVEVLRNASLQEVQASLRMEIYASILEKSLFKKAIEEEEK